MGIRGYAHGVRMVFRCVCDRCKTYTNTETPSPQSLAKFLRQYGWQRTAYDQRLGHYVWHCPKCKDAA